MPVSAAAQTTVPLYPHNRWYYEPLPVRPRYHRPSGLKFHISPAARRLRLLVYARDDFTCQHCGYHADPPAEYDGRYTIGKLTLDHIIPAYRGGLWRENNLRTLCRPCNSKRGIG